MTETSRDRSALLGTLLKVKHRKLEGYVDDVLPGAVTDPELFAHDTIMETPLVELTINARSLIKGKGEKL